MFPHRLIVAAAAVLALVVSILPVTTTPSLSANVGDGLSGLAEADLPVTLDFAQVPLGELLAAIGKASGIDFRIDAKPAERRVTIEAESMPLKLALERLASAAQVEYRLLDAHTVEVSPRAALAGQDGVTLPVVIPESKISPVYPEAAREERLEARVILQAVVRADGTVGDLEMLSSSSDRQEFADAAIAAVEQWRYEPATRNGKPVNVYFTIRVEFELRDKAPEQGERSVI